MAMQTWASTPCAERDELTARKRRNDPATRSMRLVPLKRRRTLRRPCTSEAGDQAAAHGIVRGRTDDLCPVRQANFFRGVLKMGCRTIKVWTLMTLGPNEPPRQVWMPSALY